MRNSKYFLIFIILTVIFFLSYFAKESNENEYFNEIRTDFIPKNTVLKGKFNQSNYENPIFIPVDVYIIKFNDNRLSSKRDEENINLLFNNVNKIWSQANISINITKIEFLTIEDDSVYSSVEKLYSYVIATGSYDKNKINAYFSKTLHGPNGIALTGNVIMIADFTTVFDFRATSHEIGHVLSLQHVLPVNRLMAEGVNGFEIVEEEVKIARIKALNKFY